LPVQIEIESQRLKQTNATMLKELYKSLSARLMPLYERDEARSIIRWLLEERLGVSWLAIQTDEPFVLSELQSTQLDQDLTRLEKGEPLQYVLGSVVFNDLKIAVNASVLIPRPETEEWVWQIIKRYDKHAPLKILDIGTGSGCVAIFLAKQFPNAQIIALDVSEQALQTAHANAQTNQTNIHFIQKDILEAKPHDFMGMDVIVSNPPYVPLTDQATLHPNVVNYEPHLALFAPDIVGLIFYEKITQLATHWLKEGGQLYFEIHPPHAKQVQAIMEASGLQDVNVFFDLSSRARMISARKWS
jgi:release factor glutamine methyltransferase